MPSHSSSTLSHMEAYEKKMEQVFSYLSRIPNEGAEAQKVFVTVKRSGSTLTKSQKADIPDQSSVGVYYLDWFPSTELQGEGRYTSLVTFATSLGANMGDMELSFTKTEPLDFTFKSYTKERNKFQLEIQTTFKQARLVSLGNVCETASGRFFKVFRLWTFQYELVQYFYDASGSSRGSQQSSYNGVSTKYT